MSKTSPADGLQEMRNLLKNFPTKDKEAIAQAAKHEANRAKPQGSLGKLEQITSWYCGASAKYKPVLERPRMAIFAGNHGIVAESISAWPMEVTSYMVDAFKADGGAINQLCRVADCELRVYELDLATPTKNFLHEDAMSPEEVAKAMAFGMTSAEEGIDLLCLGEMGIGNTSAASALCLAIFGGEAQDWVGLGAGLDKKDLAHKADIIAQAVARRKIKDGFDALCAFGGFELAAIIGALIAARMGKIPVVLDGFVVCAAAAILQQMRPDGLEHCMAAHLSAENAHKKLLEKLNLQPLLQLDMRLGEGSGAALAVPIIRAAIACHNDMAEIPAA